MEGGVSWACQMYFDLIEHWEKRQRAELQYPDTTDLGELQRLIDQYGDDEAESNGPRRSWATSTPSAPSARSRSSRKPEHVVDDFEAAGVKSKADLRNVFSENFYFGCEADDRATMWAFDPRMGIRLRPVFSSDFTHFDVPDFEDVIPEVYENIEKGFMTEQDFREFTFTNAARLHTRNNPDFFKGTAVEQARRGGAEAQSTGPRRSELTAVGFGSRNGRGVVAGAPASRPPQSFTRSR